MSPAGKKISPTGDPLAITSSPDPPTGIITVSLLASSLTAKGEGLLLSLKQSAVFSLEIQHQELAS